MWRYWLWVWRSGRGRRGRSQPSWTGGWASGAAHWSASHSRHEPRPNTEPTAPPLCWTLLPACLLDRLSNPTAADVHRPQPTTANPVTFYNNATFKYTQINVCPLNDSSDCDETLTLESWCAHARPGSLLNAIVVGEWGRCCLQFTLLLEPCFAYCE